jgi:hypothetical protein
VLEVTYKNGTAGLANGSTIVIGGGGAGFYPDNAPEGTFGGQIDEVNVWIGKSLTAEELSSTLVP